MKKIAAILLVALVVGHFAYGATEGTRTALVERTSVLDSI